MDSALSFWDHSAREVVASGVQVASTDAAGAAVRSAGLVRATVALATSLPHRPQNAAFATTVAPHW